MNDPPAKRIVEKPVHQLEPTFARQPAVRQQFVAQPTFNRPPEAISKAELDRRNLGKQVTKARRVKQARELLLKYRVSKVPLAEPEAASPQEPKEQTKDKEAIVEEATGTVELTQDPTIDPTV